jgi:hypothetical protein
MTEDVTLYRVRWEIEVEAETPQHAAEKARHYQTGHDGDGVRGRRDPTLRRPALRRSGNDRPHSRQLLSRHPRGAARARGCSVGAIPPRWRKR